MNSNITSRAIAAALNIYVWSGAADKSLFFLQAFDIWDI